MAWRKEDEYIRKLLDSRERWGIFLSLTAVAGLLPFLADHSHRSLVKLGPVVIGAIGSFFVFVVNCYSEQAEAISDAWKKNNKNEANRHEAAKWRAYAKDIGFLGRLHILIPIVLGTLATLILFFGIPSSTQSISNGGKIMSFSENIQIWTLVITGVGVIVAVGGVVGVFIAARAFKLNTWLKAQAIYMDKEFYEARETVLNKFGFDKNNPPTFEEATEKKHALLVCQRMDELARLTLYIKEEKIIEVWGHQMGKSWIILEKFVGDVRIQDKHLKKWDAFQRLAEKAITKYDLRN